MSAPSSERRLVENEVIFREINERTHRGFRELNRIAQEDNQREFAVGDDTVVAFYCECSDINCVDRIRISIREYSSIHRDQDKFIVLPGHEIAKIEQVIASQSDYNVVQKRVIPADGQPGKPGGLT